MRQHRGVWGENPKRVCLATHMSGKPTFTKRPLTKKGQQGLDMCVQNLNALPKMKTAPPRLFKTPPSPKMQKNIYEIHNIKPLHVTSPHF
ncbi:MAG: hypothetical protein CL920_00975 [Deltaproteobacteria bacterium]|nr:hypothetical protein [Deltaproteobacteria bacterium]